MRRRWRDEEEMGRWGGDGEMRRRWRDEEEMER